MMIDIPVQGMNIRTLAAIDVGTNTVRLLVVRGKDSSTISVLDQAQKITRLGQGLDRQLLETPMERTIEAIVNFVQKAQKFQAERIDILITSAARQAENGEEFCRWVGKAAGLEPKIISGTTEAELTVKGVLGAVPVADKNVVILDIGGGSTEIVEVMRGKVAKIESLEIGAVTLTEKYFNPSDPISEADLDRFRDDAKKILKGLRFPSHMVWVGTAGTITTLAALDQQMVKYDPLKINGYILSGKIISQWLEVLSSMPLDERRQLAGLEPGRADIIVVGVGLLDVIMNHFHLEKIMVSDAGFREGIIYNLFDEE
jgi:exopolyphosphatase/guanosine-5'-triphosphate,3'-diphosphate pyrophosphatase